MQVTTRAALSHCGALVLALPAPAQTFIVDDDGGPGVSFTSIATAIASVSQGSVLRVRAGNYAGFTISGKAISILGDDAAQVTVSSAVTVQSTLAGQSVLLTDLTMVGQHEVKNALGPVVSATARSTADLGWPRRTRAWRSTRAPTCTSTA